jgi:hypothetical protein
MTTNTATTTARWGLFINGSLTFLFNEKSEATSARHSIHLDAVNAGRVWPRQFVRLTNKAERAAFEARIAARIARAHEAAAMIEMP